MASRLIHLDKPKKWWDKNPQKFFIDQTIHCAVGAFAGYNSTRNPLVTVMVAGYVFGREQQQGKSNRRFDPHIDWTFYFLGFYLGRLIP